MADFLFSTITAAQGLSLGAADRLTIDVGTAAQTAVLYATPAADQITIVAGGRSLVVGPGATQVVIAFVEGGRLFVGATGADSFSGGGFGDAIYGGQGADTLAAGGGSNLVQGNQGDDVLQGGDGSDIVYGGQDSDQITVGAGRNFAQGNRGSDTISGGSGDNDTLLGGQGNDLIGATGPGAAGDFGLLLNPVGRTGGGDDFLNGNLGDDIIFAGAGNDVILGEDGNDNLNDAGGVNSIDGGAGNDVIVSAGSGTVQGGVGDDIVGFLPNPTDAPRNLLVSLGDGNDLSGPLSDTSTTDRFTIDGGAGDDNISGTDGADSMNGGDGADTIDGFGGADSIAGGGGSDQFTFYGGETGVVLAGLDSVLDWSSEDRLYFESDGGTPIGVGSAGNYAEATAADYAAAQALANGQIAGGVVNYVAVQVGGDLYVFADSLANNGTADSAVRLVGRALSDIQFSNFDGTTAG